MNSTVCYKMCEMPTIAQDGDALEAALVGVLDKILDHVLDEVLDKAPHKTLRETLDAQDENALEVDSYR